MAHTSGLVPPAFVRTSGPVTQRAPLLAAPEAVSGAANRGGRAARVDLRRPWTNSWFWLLQLVILAASLMRLALVVRLGLGATTPAVEYSTLLVFLPLTTVGALAFGLEGALVSCGWTFVLAIPRLTDALAHRRPSVALAELVQLAVLVVVGVATGWVVGTERRMRLRNQRALLDSAQANAIYRDLFDVNISPILVIDGNGAVVDANATAAQSFAVPTGFGSQRLHPAGTADAALRLIDVVGPDAAGEILGGLLTTVGHAARPLEGGLPAADGPPTADDPPSVSGPLTDSTGLPPVEIPIQGRPSLFRPSATMLSPDGHDRRMQIVFQDVTEERRRRELAETFAAHVVLGQEEERRRISQELHDGPLQSLIHICRQIDALTPSHPASTDAHDLRRSVESTVNEIRGIARGLRPSTLDDLGLVASIGQLLADAERRGHLGTSFGLTGDDRRMPPDVELALFRIVQEALSNIERHAAARTVAIGLEFEGGGLRLLVSDDGIGFDPGEDGRSSANQSLGIPGMVERANLIGATLVVHSRPGSGTSVDVRIPAAVLAQNR
jgi:two-component system, NarL family, sensor histidine kinase DegS